jgi:hypothetical protein
MYERKQPDGGVEIAHQVANCVRWKRVFSDKRLTSVAIVRCDSNFQIWKLKGKATWNWGAIETVHMHVGIHKIMHVNEIKSAFLSRILQGISKVSLQGSWGPGSLMQFLNLNLVPGALQGICLKHPSSLETLLPPFRWRILQECYKLKLIWIWIFQKYFDSFLVQCKVETIGEFRVWRDWSGRLKIED